METLGNYPNCYIGERNLKVSNNKFIKKPRFVTLEKSDPEYLKYLDGSFSEHLKAFPINSLNLSAKRKQTTFKVVPVEEISTPPLLISFFLAIKPQYLSLSLTPFFVFMIYLWQQDVFINKISLFLSLCSVLFFHISALLLNEYKDHMQGVDRIQNKWGSHVIQRGWLRAVQVKKGFYLFLFLGVFSSFKLFLDRPQSLSLVALVVGLSILYYSFKNKTANLIGLRETLVFLCFGPVLTFGLSQVFNLAYSVNIFFLGVTFGLLACLIVGLRSLQSLFEDELLELKTFCGFLGFDKSYLYLKILVIFSFIFVIFQFYLMSNGFVGALGLIVLCYPFLLFINQMEKLTSPMSSIILKLRKKALLCHFSFGLVLSIALIANELIVS